eukprot:GFUD01007745.1.p1 GENE.GFUD01007745.1~~GFUD01007745.1.p1  ORF type:complete len:525 (+),score=98.23 GFUD01007745.1:198-1772(+)
MIPFWTKCIVLALLVVSSRGQLRRFSNNRSRLDLLKKIVQTTQEESQEDSNNILERIGERRNTNILDRVRTRPKLPSGGPLKSKNQRRPFIPSATRGSNRNSLSDNECEDLKNENDILKQLVESVNKKKAAEAKINNVARIQDQLSQVNQPNPLSILSEALKISLGLAPTPPLPQSIPGVHDRGIRRVLSNPEPSTIYQTTSYETHLTSHVTKDISLRFQGRWKTTHVLDTIIETSTVTEILTTVITATPPAPLPQQINTVSHNEREQKKERPRSNGRFRPSTPKRANQVKIKEFRRPQRPQISRPRSRPQSLDSFQTLKNYLNNIKQNQANRPKESSSTVRPRPLNFFQDKSTEQREPKEKIEDSPKEDRRLGLFGPKELIKDQITNNNRKVEEIKVSPTTSALSQPQPIQSQATNEKTVSQDPEAVSTSIVTLFISGRVPGEYTTSLKTVIVDSSGTEVTREKRQAEGLIRPTKTVRLDHDATESDSYWDLVIESSFEEPQLSECRDHTVTVTVVETIGCHV